MSSHASVDNNIWMKAVMYAGIIAVIGLVSYGALAVGAGGYFHHEYEENKALYEEAKENGEEYAEFKEAKEAAHLQFLNFKVGGTAILYMCLVYAAFLGVGGFINSTQPNDEQHDDHDDHHEHHGSFSPIILALGVMLFLMGFPEFVDSVTPLINGEGGSAAGALMSTFGLVVVVAAVGNWWREDLPFTGDTEQIATSWPFEGQDVRKVGLWVFIMSEIMVFASFFSSYLRMRTEWCTDWAINAGVEACQDVELGTVVTASDLLRYDLGKLMPGAINTFALIISSYTIVLALKTAKSKYTEDNPFKAPKLLPFLKDKKSAVRFYLLSTFLLGSMFIVLKLIEWSHLIHEGFTIQSPQGSIFYIATGAHGLHVFIGLLIMLYMIFKSDTVEFDENNGQGIEYFGLYWHFVDLAWVAIFPAFYLY